MKKSLFKTVIAIVLIVTYAIAFIFPAPVSASGLWTSAASMASARQDHTATLLPSGKVLVTGGWNGGVYLSTTELYNPASDTWSSAASMASARDDHTATLLLSGKVLVTGGGSNGSVYLSSTELYDPVTNTWSPGASMATKRFLHTATLLNSGKVLVTGGSNGSGYLSSTELYDPVTNAWSSAASMASARADHTATLLPSGKVLVTGGRNGSGYLSSTELYNPATNTWSPVASMASARADHTATLLASGKVLVTGGWNGGVYLSSAELYDPVTIAWSSAGSMASGRADDTATLLPSGKVLVIGGWNGGVYLSSTELYDPVTNTWSSAASMASKRSFHTATLLNSGKVLVTGGEGVGVLCSAEIYTEFVNISGNAGIGGASVSYTGGTPVTADDSGNYSFPVPSGWSGTVTPSKIGYVFSPVDIPYSNIVADQLNQNYTATAVATFADVPTTYWAWSWIERLYSAGITGGCGGGNYCPDNTVTRAQIAIFLERGMHGSTYTPPAGTGTVFGDVPISYWADSWIEKLYADGITGGCGGGNYCPGNSVTRAQMAIFLLRAEHGSSYTPPPATGTDFGDVPISYWDAAWIEKLSAEGITGGCGGGNYCPANPVTRAQMAVFLVRTFSLP